MRFPSLGVLLAAASFSAVVVIPFLPAAKTGEPAFHLELCIAAANSGANPGALKIYYDLGRGYNEADSAQAPASTAATTLRLPLPSGAYRSLRLDPIEGPGRAVFDGPVRIVSDRGVRRTLPLETLKPLHQIASTERARDQLVVTAAADADDPQLVVNFSPALVLTPTWSERLHGWLPRAAAVFGLIVALMGALARAPRMRAWCGDRGAALLRHPLRAVASVAAVATIASSYPVVFLGKSFVSPNFGTTLLYEAYPSLPGYDSAVTASGNGSDVGALMWQHVPYAFIQRRALAGGELPLWNRHTLTGAPLLGQGQSMFGDPLHLLVLLCDGAAWAWDLKFLIAKWLFATGLGLAVLALLPGPADQGPLGPALMVSAAAPFIGFFVFRINHPAIFSLAWAPWVLLCWVHATQAVSWRPATRWLSGLVLANTALLSSGTVKEAYLLALQMNATGLCLMLATPAPWRARTARLGGALAAVVVFALLTAPTWGLFLQALPHAYTASSRAAVDQIQPSLLLGAFDELFYRPLSKGDIVFNPSLNFLLLLGVLYFVATAPRQFADRARVALAGCALVALAFAFGLVPPTWIARVPFLGHVGHIDNVFSCGLLVLWSVLAGLGFHAALALLGSPEGRGDLALVLTLLAGLTAAWIGFGHASHRMMYGPGTMLSVLPSGQVLPVSPFIWGSLIALLLASLALGLAARSALVRGSLGPAALIVVVTCAVVLLWRHGLHAEGLGFSEYLVQPPARARFHAKSEAIAYVGSRQQPEPRRLFGLHGNVTPGWNAVYGLEAIYGPDALQTAPLRELIDASPVAWNSSWRLYLASKDVGRARPFLDALNVGFYLDLPGNPPPADASLARVHAADLNVFESQTAWPRAFFIDRIEVYDKPAELVARLMAANGRPFAALHRDDPVVRGQLAALRLKPAARTVVPATDYRLTENTTSFRIRAEQAGVVVLGEAWWPRTFRATVNGRRVPVLRVNHAFKGILLDRAGDYRVEFSCWPANLTLYLALSAVAAVILGTFLFVSARRESRPGTERCRWV